jgi:hypothetical protein
VIYKFNLLFCGQEHGTGDICFPDLTQLDAYAIQQIGIKGNTVRSLRNEAKKAGWGRINGEDYCPACMESMQ